MDIDDAVELLQETSYKLGQVHFNADNTLPIFKRATFREATNVEQNLLNLWIGEPKINMELQNVQAYCNANRNDISCLLELADLLNRFGVFPQLAQEAERMVGIFEEKSYEVSFLRNEYEAGQETLNTSQYPRSTTKHNRKKEHLEELENITNQYKIEIEKKKKQISIINDQIQEKSNILDDLDQVFIAEEEEEYISLEKETSMLSDEIKERKRIIRDYEEEYIRQEQTEIQVISPPLPPSPPTTSIEQSDFDKTFKQLEDSLNELLLTDKKENDDLEVNHENLMELTNELNEISLQLQKQVNDIGLPNQAQEYADKLSTMMKKTVEYISKHREDHDEEEGNEEVVKLRQLLPNSDYSLSTTEKIKTSILAEVQNCDISLQDLKDKLKTLGYKEMQIVTSIYKLNTNGLIFVDRDQPVTMVKCIYPFDA